MRLETFDLTRLPESYRPAIAGVLEACDWPDDRLADSYVRDQAVAEGTANIIIEVRPGLPYAGSWSDQGYIALSPTLPPTRRGIGPTLLHELGHGVDKLGGLTTEHRRVIRVILHDGVDDGHPWLREESIDHGSDDYMVRVGEAWANLFAVAYSPTIRERKVDKVNYPAHPATIDRARLVRGLVTPELGPAPWLEVKRRYRVIEIRQGQRDAVIEEAIGPVTYDLSAKIAAGKPLGHKYVIR